MKKNYYFYFLFGYHLRWIVLSFLFYPSHSINFLYKLAFIKIKKWEEGTSNYLMKWRCNIYIYIYLFWFFSHKLVNAVVSFISRFLFHLFILFPLQNTNSLWKQKARAKSIGTLRNHQAKQCDWNNKSERASEQATQNSKSAMAEPRTKYDRQLRYLIHYSFSSLLYFCPNVFSLSLSLSPSQFLLFPRNLFSRGKIINYVKICAARLS